jgi:hypothetical protein
MNGPGSIIARSVSRTVWERMERDPLQGKVLAVFQRACLLLLPRDSVVALVLPEIGNGPLNIVLERLDPLQELMQPGIFSAIESGMVTNLEGERVRVGGLEVALGGAETWEPRPDWARLRQNQEQIKNRLPVLGSIALRQCPADSLLSLLSTKPDLTGLCRTLPHPRPVRSGTVVVQEALQYLLEGWAGDLARLQCGGGRLAGLGGGLTPAGDDFLTGVMLWAWLAHPMPQPFCQLLLQSAAPRTNTLSVAFLRAAAEGECNAAWHDLLAALVGGMEHQFAGAAKKVLSLGHTSGADALAGFVWMGLESVQPEIAQEMGDS